MQGAVMDDLKFFAPVSVVIPCYRCGATIGRALDSVFSQSWRPAEVILVEDFSEDNTLEVIYELQGAYPAGWVRVIKLDSNQGPSVARNIGWESSTQDLIAFLDADDSWHPQKIEFQAKWMRENPTVALTASDFETVQKTPTTYVEFESVEFKTVSASRLLLSNRFSTPSVVLKRDIHHRFEPNKRYSEDYLLWLNICLDGNVCCRADNAMVFLYKSPYGEPGLSGNLWEMEKGELGNYKFLYDVRRISLIRFILLSGYSLAKYLRRLAVVNLRQAARHRR